MTGFSVVVANVCGDPAAVGPCLDALRREAAGGDQVVWVDAAGLVPDAAVDYVPAAVPARGPMYALGLAAARHPVVAFTDSATVFGPGWRHAATAALTAGAGAVGGPVLPGPRRSVADAAGFRGEYGPHAAPPFTSATGDVAANNVAYCRAVLAEVLAPGEPLWKSVVDGRLAGRGRRPALVTAMAATSTKAYRWRDLGPVRAAHGRLYGAQRARGWPWPRRVVAAAGCAVLPALAYARLAGRVARTPELRRLLLRATPLVLLALAAWSAGEAWGCLAGDPGEVHVF